MTGMGFTYASALTEVGIGLETNPGVAVPPTMQLVVDKAPDPSDEIGKIEDKGMRGSMVETWDIIAGTASTTISLSGAVMADTLPFLLSNILGDTVYQGTATGSATTLAAAVTPAQITTGATSIQVTASIAAGTVFQIDTAMASEVRTVTTVTGAGPYTVNFTEPLKVPHLNSAVVTPITAAYTTIQSLMNGGGYGGQAQPPTLTITDLNQVSANFGRQYAGWSADSLSIKSSPSGLLTFEAKGTAYPSSVLASVPTLPVSSVEASAGWQTTVSLAGAQTGGITEWELDLTRKIEVIDQTDGTQTPYAIRRGALGASTKFRVVAANEQPLLTYLAQNNIAIVYGLTNGLTGANQLSHSFNCPKVRYVSGTKIDRSKEEVGFNVEAEPLPLSSAAGWTGGGSRCRSRP